ncbi:MAG: hypothetical protein PHV61_02905 [Limnochordia bacterium]|jgi:Flp pilus assembly pilin Flp|nr:hypothetical protein [Limnochordia bacterium]MDD2629108.1 hypothetical protein [Limnochordia bacterium]MDD4517290.1 hypothetical protein [Limnochordia bacterium]
MGSFGDKGQAAAEFALLAAALATALLLVNQQFTQALNLYFQKLFYLLQLS